MGTIKDKFIGQRVIARGNRSGVYYGTLTAREGQECVLANVRNIWHWEGAATLLQVSAEGVKSPDSCNFTMFVDEIVLTDVVELLPCTQAAINNIEGVKEWKIRQ